MGFFEKLKRKKRDILSRHLKDDLAGALNEEKRDMIRGVVDLSETSVKEVMVPRIDVDFIPLNIESAALLRRIAESGHTRFPVYKETTDDVVGILYVKDLISLMAKAEALNVEKVLRKPFFVPDSKRIDSLLREFKRRRVHIAVAADEYGGVSGIVCLEDIIEEIVGDLQDEFDDEEEGILSIGDGAWLCDGRLALDDLADTLKSDLPSDEFDTLGGFVFNLFGKVPVRYETVRWNGFDFIVQAMDGHRITTVKVVKKKDSEAAEEGERNRHFQKQEINEGGALRLCPCILRRGLFCAKRGHKRGRLAVLQRGAGGSRRGRLVRGGRAIPGGAAA